MGKLQKIERKNGTKVYNVTLPVADIESLGWKKGDMLHLLVIDGKIIISKIKGL